MSALPADAGTAGAFPYEGPPELHLPVQRALARVVDPEVALNIVDVGLVYGVRVHAGRIRVRVTMTSTACPVTDVILDEIESELDRAVPAGYVIEVELTWDPPWSPERMSARGRAFMGW